MCLFRTKKYRNYVRNIAQLPRVSYICVVQRVKFRNPDVRTASCESELPRKKQEKGKHLNKHINFTIMKNLLKLRGQEKSLYLRHIGDRSRHRQRKKHFWISCFHRRRRIFWTRLQRKGCLRSSLKKSGLHLIPACQIWK